MNIIELYESGYTVKQISKRLNIKCVKIYEILETKNYYTKGKTHSDAFKLKESIEMYLNNNKLLLCDVSSITKIDPEVLSKYLRRLGINPRDRQNKPKINQHVFDNINTEEKAYWLGFIFADGYIEKIKPNMKYVFSFCLAYIDYDHLLKFNKFMGFDGDKIYVDYLLINGVKKPRCKWSVGNKHLWNTLNNLGCTPRKTFTLQFPKIKKELIVHFIRGYFDGDGTLGSYGKRKQPSCSVVGTDSIINNIMEFSGMVGGKYIHKGHDKRTFTLSYTSQKSIDFTTLLYKDSTIHLERKYKKYLDMCRSWEKSHELLQTNIGED